MEQFSGESTSTKKELKITRREVFDIVKVHMSSKSLNEMLILLESYLSNLLGNTYPLKEIAKPKIYSILSKMKQKWQDSNRIEKKFLNRYADWLEVPVIDNASIHNSTHRIEAISTSKTGRPSTNFVESSNRKKRRKTENMRKDHSVEELGFATQMKLRADGKLHAAKVVEEVVLGAPSCASKYKRSLEESHEVPFSGEEALSLLINNNLSKSQYTAIRSASLDHQSKLFPSYHNVLAAKTVCHPPKSEMKITETCTEVNLQALLNHTAERILLLQTDTLENLETDKVYQVTLICKWGCDGTTSQGKFKQKFENDDGCKNDEYILEKQINEEGLQFGMSILHAWIRFFECLLHVSYRLEIKQWQVRGADNKKKLEERKRKIQNDFRTKMGLLVDQPKQGYGSTNDGNTARRFFQNSTLSSSITGIDKEIIDRFHVILQTISSDCEVNIGKFQEYAEATARKFVELYPWYYMPTSVHKILVHGPKIIRSSLLPIGMMSEEAQESCNKLIKKFRKDFSRKSRRIQTMEDVFLRLLIMSDPIVSSFHQVSTKKIKLLSAEATMLLNYPKKITEEFNSDTDCSISSDSE